ncbi:MAG: VCBS repeat-containing protein [Planctomycetota bacterium]|nr:VCBS repeat-containing protein [Planctomycetota bacterium]
MRTLISLAALATLASPAAAQLTDLQPGRNFPTAATNFGSGRSENLDVGDIDNDGDFDVGVANGGDGSAQGNYIYLNNGGAQGGVEGTFTNASSARLSGFPNDTSRDLEFADFDMDNDLDIYISNRGTTVNGGEVSRAGINQGGMQGGSTGFFSERTDDFWGTLVSVPGTDEVGTVNGEGAWRDYSCDCDFADLDNDGDLDLFHSSYGPNINGTRDSRIFLNDGTGRFDEMWTWAAPGADIRTHTLDIDLADLDGDYDLDVIMSSRDSQARIFRSNLNGATTFPANPFTDITQTALLNQGAIFSGDSNYEGEFGDLDGDGDFDIWMKNYQGFTDRILRNNGNLTFTQMNSWIAGDPSVDENEVDLFDYDGDGDLDAFLANFSGTNRIYQSSLADGGGGALYTRSGSGAAANETPSSSNSGTTLDGEAADMDGDGDVDLMLANDGNQANRYWENVLGVPDTHAPTFERFTQQGNKSDGTDTVILAQVRDNHNYYNIDYYNAFLIYTVDGANETCVSMFAQRGQQFRGVIPGGIDGAISYHVEVTDDAGNTGTSTTVSYNQTSSGTPVWENLGCGTPGFDDRAPYLEMIGTQAGGSPISLKITDGNASSPALVWLSFSSTPISAIGGVVYAFPFSSQVPIFTQTDGSFFATTTWPAGLPVGTDHYWQALVGDASSIHEITMTNAVHGQQP